MPAHCKKIIQNSKRITGIKISLHHVSIKVQEMTMTF